jgi:Tol biopolymer transport system component
MSGWFSSGLWTMAPDRSESSITGSKPEVFLNTAADERWPSFSPDERWLAYGSNESGGSQVSVRAFPDRGVRVLIGNGVYPVWARNGRELFFRAEDNRIMVVSYTAKGDTFVPGAPRIWSDRRTAAKP